MVVENNKRVGSCTGGAVVQSFGVPEHDDRGYNTLHEAFDWLTQRVADSS